MTSIDFFANEVYQAIDLHSQGKLSPTYCLVKIVEAKNNAIELAYKETMDATQKGIEMQEKENNRVGFRERNGLLELPQQEILDEEIDKQANRLCWEEAQKAFKSGAKWYREQLKNINQKVVK